MYLEFREPETAEAIAAWEEALGMDIPEELKLVLMEKGACSSGCPMEMEERTFQIDTVSECRSMGTGLIAHIDELWGGRPEFEDSFSEDEIALINRNYVAFAEVCVNQNAYVHYYFDGSGQFGWLYYDQDDFEAAEALYFRPLLEASQANYSFDEIVSHMVSTCLSNEDYDSIGEVVPGERWEQALERMREAAGGD